MSDVQAAPTTPGTGPAATTIIAAVIVIFFGAVWSLLAAILMVVLAGALVRGGERFETLGQSIALIFAPLLFVLLLILLLMGLLTIWMGWRLLKRGNGARWTAIVVFGLFGLSALGGNGGSARFTGEGRLGSALFLALVPVLLLLPPSIQDFRTAKERRQARRMMPPAPGAPAPP
jgi:hypothetical protein